MYSLNIYFSIFFFACLANRAVQTNLGSGANGNLRLCVVEGRGKYKRVSKFCPVLDSENSKVECVVGTDRLDCLRRISKGTVDFGVFYPEDLIAAQWANVDVLVTNELRDRQRPFERSIVAIVNKKILPESVYGVHAVLRNSTLCHPGYGEVDRKPLSETLSEYLESLVTAKSCDPKLSVLENRMKGMAQFFSRACIAGPWLKDEIRDTDLKMRYSTLCSACGGTICAKTDRYWGTAGALLCLAEGSGDFTWSIADNAAMYFGLVPGARGAAEPDHFAFLCRDGSWQPMRDNHDPCVWVNRPWRVVVAKRKTAAEVSSLTASLSNRSLIVENDSYVALAALLEINEAQPDPLHPPKTPLDYLAHADGFREAYSQTGCQPPRHITLCASSALAKNKCEWLSEAGAVYGVAPPLQCAYRPDVHACMRAIRSGECDVTVADSDWLIRGLRDYSVAPILHEQVTIDKASTVGAFVRIDSKLTDIRGKRAAFPLYDGLAWHAVKRYVMSKEKISCSDYFAEYFSEICAPGIEKFELYENHKENYRNSCIEGIDNFTDGDIQALRSLVEARSDVAFIDRKTWEIYEAKLIDEPWAKSTVKIIPVCPDENEKYCSLSWANVGHVFAGKNITSLRRHEIINLFTKLDQLFGKMHPFHTAMFSMYGPFNHRLDVLFDNNTNILATDQMSEWQYTKYPMSFEKDLKNIDIARCINHSSNIKFTVLLISLVLLITIRDVSVSN